MTKRYYLAYGSNLNVMQMAFRCPEARVIGTAWIDGYRLLFKGSKTGSYLTIEKKEGYRVPVGVWEVSEEDERNLDRYEGYPSFYYKKEMKLAVRVRKTGNETELDCFVYIMHEERKLGIPTGYYMAVCEEGYEWFAFDKSLLYQAYEHSIRIITKKKTRN